MPIVWVLLIFILLVLCLWFLWYRHGGDLGDAMSELWGWLGSAFDWAVPHMEPLFERIREHPIRNAIILLVLLVLIVGGSVVAYKLAHPPAPPPMVWNLGDNIVLDNCGNPVTVWVGFSHTDQRNRRIEVTPAEAGNSIDIQVPGGTVACRRTIHIDKALFGQ